MSIVKKRIIIICSACLLAIIGIQAYLLPKNYIGKMNPDGSVAGEVDEMTGEAADIAGEDDGLIPEEQLCEADITEPDEMTLLSNSSVGERIFIGSYGSEEVGWIVYDEDDNLHYLIF